MAVQTYVDRSSKAKARRRRSRERLALATFDAPAFLTQHWQAVFSSVFKQLRLDDADFDGPIGTKLAGAYRAFLAEQERLDGAAGPAFKCWQALLRELKP